MAVLHITGTVTDSAGLSTPFTGTINTLEYPVVNSVVVTPDPVVAGQEVTITINATDPNGGELTYTCLVDGVAATPVAGQPNQFTFTT